MLKKKPKSWWLYFSIFLIGRDIKCDVNILVRVRAEAKTEQEKLSYMKYILKESSVFKILVKIRMSV